MTLPIAPPALVFPGSDASFSHFPTENCQKSFRGSAAGRRTVEVVLGVRGLNGGRRGNERHRGERDKTKAFHW